MQKNKHSLALRISRRLRHEVRKRWLSVSNSANSLALLEPKIGSMIQLQQFNLKAALRRSRDEGRPVDLLEYPFRVFSQVDEDGILFTIFSQLGIDCGRSVEIGAGLGPYTELECNTANLIVHHGWQGLILDGSDSNVKALRTFFENNWSAYYRAPRVQQAFISAENINSLLEQNSFAGDIDLFSLDIDGVDWWVLKSLEIARPKVLVLEFNDIWPYSERKTVPYSSNFDHREHNEPGLDAYYFGASLGALVSLAESKGYRFLGINRACTNAFLLRSDLSAPTLKTKSFDECPISPRTVRRRRDYADRIRGMPWVEA